MKKFLMLLSFMLFIPSVVYASDTATVKITSSKEKVAINDKIDITVSINSTSNIGYYEYTLSYDSNKLDLLKGSAYVVDKTNNNNTKEIKKTFSFKVIGKGASKISITSYGFYNSSNGKMDVKINPITVSTSSVISTESDNNYLSSLKVKDIELTPAFDKKITKYNIKLDKKIKEIIITAVPESKKATITGDGSFEITEGENTFEIVVTSEKGTERIYTITTADVESKDKEVIVDGKKYTLIKSIGNINIPKGYNVKKITIDSEEVESLYNDTTKVTLIGLKDANGKVVLYIYDTDSKEYSKYKVIDASNIAIMPLSTDKTLKGYDIYKETINDTSVACYKINSSSNFCAIYAVNTADGKEGWYMYDLEQNTIQRYDNDADSYHKDNLKSTQQLIYILSATTLLFGVTTIAFAIKSNKNKK